MHPACCTNTSWGLSTPRRTPEGQVFNAPATSSHLLRVSSMTKAKLRGRVWRTPLLVFLLLCDTTIQSTCSLEVCILFWIMAMPETFPTLLESHSPSNSDSRSLSKFTSYSYANDGADAVLDVTAFSVDGFSDFQLDLSLLSATAAPSPPPSPPPLTDSPFSSYLPSSPPSSSRRSVSFSTNPPASIARSASAPRLSTSPRVSLTSAAAPSTNAATGSGSGAWTLSKYVPKGTPIDRGRRSQWSKVAGSASGSDDASDVAEDGVLFSTVRSTSVDSERERRAGAGPRWHATSTGASQRSISPLAEWNYVSPPPPRAHTFAGRGSGSGGGRPRSAGSISAGVPLALAPLPESVAIHLDGLHPEASADWASSMRAALGDPVAASTPALSPSPSTPTPPSAAQSTDELLRTPSDGARGGPPDDGGCGVAHRSPSAEAHSDLDAGPGTGLDSSLHTAAEQGLGGMTWFDAGILPGRSPGPGSTCASTVPSVYSCDQLEPEPVPLSDTRTPLRMRARGSEPRRRSSASRREWEWWRRLLRRLRRLQAIVLRGNAV
ncbi:hypothetical protein GGX14DRAFT_661206 [Mycena pura]|uniref:Uncharacterized protein n=1 Tax=Mycena pura TaxID=153505 RepID=A0AAD6V545_9AGAR|nr:hypothetical protein GGX14DRAFT_661206 [Mycena pura]